MLLIFGPWISISSIIKILGNNPQIRYENYHCNQETDSYIQIVANLYSFAREAMKLRDCDCGGIPQVTYEINDHNDYVVGCTICDNRAPLCENLSEAVSLWNETFCCEAPSAFEMESV